MFKDTKAFSSFSVNDLEKAKQFYGEVLQVDISEEKEMGLLQLHLKGGNDIVVYPKPDHSPATFTVLNFSVPQIETAVDELKKRGVIFESYNMPDLKTGEDQISRSDGHAVAWFKDPAGNILSVMTSGS
ncbi:VOC family protein [Dyadobacter sp. NIV53]|uniref:VOC family protein n=1 Tax=Dyadobacter sp. NIV53 TaxID=2861765 RepID=UPI001C86BF3A|nr:VOC family protein [Dyadobacter sp. NIV53]